MRRLSKAEIAKKQELGLYFKCGSKFGLNHQCANKQLSVLILSEMEDNDDERERRIRHNTKEQTQNDKAMALSMNSIVDLTEGKTMKLIGSINGKQVMVLIDSGASHNFISSQVVSILKIPILSKKFVVTIRDGYQVQRKETYKGMEIELQGAHVKQDFYSFDLGGEDLVLGVEWLESLGDVKVNWKQFTEIQR